MAKPVVSIIICTRNRAQELAATLQTLAACAIPASLPTELLVVDNASIDDTPQMLARLPFTNLECRVLQEPRGGKSRALNTAMKAAQGQILLFTDDDVRVPPDWVSGMAQPIMSGQADGVCGGVRRAAYLLQQPQAPAPRGSLIFSARALPAAQGTQLMVGLNMAFRRSALQDLGGFDSLVGPGTPYAACEDVLFSLQFYRAGYKIKSVPEVVVEHHPDPVRLTRTRLWEQPQGEGRTSAYIQHHWEHQTIRLARVRLLKHLSAYALKKLTPWPRRGAGSASELGLVREIAFYRQYLRERKLPHRYPPHGLYKRNTHPLIGASVSTTDQMNQKIVSALLPSAEF